jgi:hypothetical protein
MANKLKLILLVAFVIMSFSHSAQDASQSTLRETGNWNGIYLKIRLNEKFGYYGEHHLRFRNSADNLYDFVGRPRQIYNRAGINIYFNKYFEGVIGPTYVLNFSPDFSNSDYKKVVGEPRIWHQWLFIMPPMGRIKVYHQFRFEHRWKKSNFIGDNFDYTNRYRYKIFAYIPLNNDKIEEKTWYFSPSAELFMHSGQSIVMNPFEDFRTYNGIGYVLNQRVTFFAGHMWTFGQTSTGFQYAKSHIIRLNVFIGLDSRNIEDHLPKINIGY